MEAALPSHSKGPPWPPCLTPSSRYHLVLLEKGQSVSVCWPKPPHFWLRMPAGACWGLLGFLVMSKPQLPQHGSTQGSQDTALGSTNPVLGPQGSQHGWPAGLGRDTQESPHTKSHKWPRGRVSDPQHSPGAWSIGEDLLPLSSVWQGTGRAQEGTGRMQHLALSTAAAELSVGMSVPGREPAQAPPDSSNELSWVCSAHLHLLTPVL